MSGDADGSITAKEPPPSIPISNNNKGGQLAQFRRVPSLGLQIYNIFRVTANAPPPIYCRHRRPDNRFALTRRTQLGRYIKRELFSFYKISSMYLYISVSSI